MHRSAESFAMPNRVAASRRQFLQVATAAVGGIAASGTLPAAAFGNATIRRGKAVIFVYLAGGPSHLDTYDMKPDAPAEIRGEFRPIATNVPGMRVCEQLPLHARVADKLAIVNGVETIDTQCDAVISTGHLRQQQRLSFCEVAALVTEQSAGCVPEKPVRAEVGDLKDPVVQLRHALSIVESGAPAVTITLADNCLPYGDWDTHGKVLSRPVNIFQELRAKLPVYDRAIYDLVTALHHRGLHRDVLVVICGEFGRTPWINRHGGRDHWASCGSVVFAGGGLRTGQIIGNTGPIGERSTSRPYTAQNVLATIYRHLGIDPALQIRTADGRTVALLDDRQVIEELV